MSQASPANTGYKKRARENQQHENQISTQMPFPTEKQKIKKKTKQHERNFT